MAELVVVAFDNVTEADRALMELARLQKEYLIDLEDAVVAIRQPDGKVNLKQSINLVGLGAERTRAMSSRGDSSSSVAVQPSMQRLPLRPIFAKHLQGLFQLARERA
jgi:hypothetical protein